MERRMSRFSTGQQIGGLVAWLVLCFAAAGIGAIASLDAPTFYAALQRPDWAPPASWFGPVWTALYALMGIAAWLVWRVDGWRDALWLFVFQLVLNTLWSWLFFSWHLGLGAFIDIVLLWLAIVATMVAFWRVKPLAGALLLPYLAWVSFATALNFAVWQANPTLLG
jgi:translocator protein